MKKTILLIIIILLFASFTASADPSVSFTVSSESFKTVLTPHLNADVTHYKWSIMGIDNNYNSETGWIPAEDSHCHISMLDNGRYFVTIHGKNATMGDSFTNEIKVYIEAEYVRPVKEEVEEDIGSLIIHNLPEPLRTFFSERSSFELLLIVLASLLFLAVLTRRKKINVYVKLERFYGK